jgi:hypothetical protein
MAKVELIEEYRWKYPDKQPPQPGCYDCGMPYGYFPDLILSDELWEKVNPSIHKGGGLLCPTCICIRLAKIGVNDINIKVFGDGKRDYHKIAYTFYCPGCKYNHIYFVKGFNKIWQFNGDVDNPTFTPSLLNRIPATDKEAERNRCHLFVKNGRIEYCNDCFHELKGKTVEMEDTENGR